MIHVNVLFYLNYLGHLFILLAFVYKTHEHIVFYLIKIIF